MTASVCSIAPHGMLSLGISIFVQLHVSKNLLVLQCSTLEVQLKASKTKTTALNVRDLDRPSTAGVGWSIAKHHITVQQGSTTRV